MGSQAFRPDSQDEGTGWTERLYRRLSRVAFACTLRR